MTAQEKADELVKRMYAVHSNSASDITLYFAKQCALVAVNEILEMHLPILEEDADAFYDYWEQVKQEIESYEIK
jgi:hypothetical protein